MTLQERLQQIKVNWVKLSQLDEKMEIFGASSHGYNLWEPVSLEEIESGEMNFGFKLPEAYREYMLRVSNGGAGPFYGIYPLVNSLVPLGDDYLENNPDHYSKPFPFVGEDAINYMHLVEEDGINEPLVMDAGSGGYLFVSEYGSGGYYIMPLNGENAGDIWFMQVPTTTVIKSKDGSIEASASNRDGDDNKNGYYLYPQYKRTGDNVNTIPFLEWIEDHQNYYLTPGNFISDPNKPFENPSQVFNIFIQNKDVPEIPEHIYTCQNLSSITIHSSRLSELSPSIANLKQLKSLDLFFNAITELPQEIGELSNLENLSLRSNSVKSLPSSIGKLHALLNLDLSFNPISELPDEFYKLTNLQYLYCPSLNKTTRDRLARELPNLVIH